MSSFSLIKAKSCLHRSVKKDFARSLNCKYKEKVIIQGNTDNGHDGFQYI